MRFTLLCLLLLCSAAWGAESPRLPAAHFKAVEGLGLPLFLLPNDASAFYRESEIWMSRGHRGYRVEYWQRGEPLLDMHVRCATRQSEPPQPVKVLERRQAVVPALGPVTVERYKGGCRTGWTAAGQGFVQVEVREELPLDRFVQVLEGVRKAPAVPRRSSVRQDALRAAGLPDLHLAGREPSMEGFSFSSAREWHNRFVEYQHPTFSLDMARGGIGDVGVGYSHPSLAEQTVQIPGIGRVFACQSKLTYGKRPVGCYTEWQKVGKGYFHARSDVSFGRFVELLTQLRIR